MKVWLTGCSGMLGQALARQLAEANVEYFGTDIDVDLTSQVEIQAFCRNASFTHIVNAAAYTRVDDAETDFDKACAVNGTAVRYLSEEARRQSANLVHFSTDYVFAGNAPTPYLETAPTGPMSAYGKSKLEGEQWALFTQGSASSYVLRTSWLFGFGGANFVRTILNAMMLREEVRVVHDQKGRPTYTEDLAAAALALAGIGERPSGAPGIYHFANSGAVSWYDFTLAIAEVARAKGMTLKVRRIVPVSTSEFPRPAPRPAYSVLDTTKIERSLGEAPRDYGAALADYLDALIPTLAP